MNPRILIFDVETTGLFPNKRETTVTLDKYPYVIQLSFILYNLSTGNIEKQYNNYIRIPDSVVIPDEVVQLTGITRTICNKQGVNILSAINELHDAYMLARTIVAHNLEFDQRMIKVELQRNYNDIQYYIPYCLRLFDNDYEMIAGIKSYCTMKHGLKMCNIVSTPVGLNGETKKPFVKWPRLNELYYHLFQETVENMHNSMVDVLACMRCYLKMKQNIVVKNEEFTRLLQTV
uniref:Exonuclease domain-containing protein n=1 Tax=viral metagenome TaxID=1070528 RepID=A0A6C0DRM3_9ZZZZ